MMQTKSRHGRHHINHDKARSQAKNPEKIPQLGLMLDTLGYYRLVTPWQLARRVYLAPPSGEVRSVGAALTDSRRALLTGRIAGIVAPKSLGYYNRQDKWAATTAFTLTPSGRDLLQELAEAAGTEIPIRWTPGVLKWQPPFALHFMRVVDALISLEAAMEAAGYAVLERADDTDIKAFKAAGRWSSAIIPDGYLLIDTGQKLHSLVIEVDRNTEDLTGLADNSWTAKMAKYAAFFKGIGDDPFWADKPDPLVLIFAPDPKRMEAIAKTVKREKGRSNYWLATFDALSIAPPPPAPRPKELPKFAPNPVYLAPDALLDYPFKAVGLDEPRYLRNKFRL